MFIEQTIKAIRDLKTDCEMLDRQYQAFGPSMLAQLQREAIYAQWKEKRQKVVDLTKALGSDLFLAVENWDDEKLSDFFRQLER